MKITYTKEEVASIMKEHISDMIDVDITDIEFSAYSVEFLTIICTKKAKEFETEPSYQT